MRFIVKYSGSGFAAVEAQLKKGEVVKAESDAMVTKTQYVDVAGRMSGGLLGGLARLVLTNESLFLQELTATRDDGCVLLAPSYPGDIVTLDLTENDSYIIAQGAFLCAEQCVNISTHTQSLAQGMFSKQGLFLLHAVGPGTLAICAYGAIERYQLQPGEVLDVDNGHLVAWTARTQYSMTTASNSWISSVTSGEGLVCRFQGPGTVYIQTRSLQGLRQWMNISGGERNTGNSIVGVVMFGFLVLVFLAFVAFVLSQPDVQVQYGQGSRRHVGSY